MSFEKKSFDECVKKHKEDVQAKRTNQRLGQVLYDYFKLYKSVNQSQFNHLYEKDGKEAIECFLGFADLT